MTCRSARSTHAGAASTDTETTLTAAMVALPGKWHSTAAMVPFLFWGKLTSCICAGSLAPFYQRWICKVQYLFFSTNLVFCLEKKSYSKEIRRTVQAYTPTALRLLPSIFNSLLLKKQQPLSSITFVVGIGHVIAHASINTTIDVWRSLS